MKEPKVDERTREYLTKWGRWEVPTAQVTGGSVNPGVYRGMVALGWMMHQGPVPVCGLHFLVLQNHTQKAMATLSLAMPVTKTTELHVNSFLHLMGWDGRVWPYDGDGGWPENSEEDAEQVREMLQKLHPRVGSTLAFPPIPDLGSPIITLTICKRSAPFPFAPFEPVPEEQDSPVVHLARFRELCKDPSPFQVPN